MFGLFGGGGKDFAGTGTNLTYSTGINYTRTWTNTLVMEARGGMSYYHNEALSAGAGQKTAQEMGIPGANIDEWTSGMTQIDITGLQQPGGRLRGEPALGSLRADGAVRDGLHQGRPATTRSSSARTCATTATSCCRRRTTAGRAGVPVPRAADGDSHRRGGADGFANAFASFLLDVPAGVGRDLKVVEPGHASLGVLHVHPGQVAGVAESDDRPRAAARVLHAAHGPGRAGGRCRTTIPRPTRCSVAGYGDVARRRRRREVLRELLATRAGCPTGSTRGRYCAAATA